jgi:urea transport system permease protein
MEWPNSVTLVHCPLKYISDCSYCNGGCSCSFCLYCWHIYLRSKISGVYITIITLALSSALTTFFVSQQAYTGGTNGITDVSSLSLFGITVPLIGLYFIILAFTTLVMLGSWLLTQSNFGLILRSIKENEQRISYLGYDVASYKILFGHSPLELLGSLEGCLYL